MFPGRSSRPLSSISSRPYFLNSTRVQQRESIYHVQVRAGIKIDSTVASSTRASPLPAPAPKRRRISPVDRWGEDDMSAYLGGPDGPVEGGEERVGGWRPYSSRWRDAPRPSGNRQDKEAGSRSGQLENGNAYPLGSSNPGISSGPEYQGSYAQPMYAQDTPWAWSQQGQNGGNMDSNHVPADTYDATQQPFLPQQFSQFPFHPGFNPFNVPMWNTAFGMNNAQMLPFMSPIPSNGFFPNFGLPGSVRPFSTMPFANDGTTPDWLSDLTQPFKPKSKTPPEPHPTPEYIEQASSPAIDLASPQPLLIVLDLNGTLIYRTTKKSPAKFVSRVKLNEFLDTLLKNPKKYKILIWSSSQPHNVKSICAKLFPGEKRKALVGEWGRDKFGLTGSQYSSKIQVYKRLETVWEDPRVQASYPGATRHIPTRTNPLPPKHWNQTNTVLIDDSKLKALSEPYNILEIPEFTNTPVVDERWIFPSLIRTLETLAKYDDVSKVIRGWNLEAEGLPWGAKENGPTQLESLSPSPSPAASPATSQPPSRSSSPPLPGEQVTDHPSHAFPHLHYMTQDPKAERKASRKAKREEKKKAKAAAKKALKVTEQTQTQSDTPATTSKQSRRTQNRKRKEAEKAAARAEMRMRHGNTNQANSDELGSSHLGSNSNSNLKPGLNTDVNANAYSTEMGVQNQPQSQTQQNALSQPKGQTKTQMKKARKAWNKAIREAQARHEVEPGPGGPQAGSQAQAGTGTGTRATPGSPARSENYLLDRLEESLNS